MNEKIFIDGKEFVKSNAPKDIDIDDFVITNECSENNGEFYHKNFVGKVLARGKANRLLVNFNYPENSFSIDDGKWFCSPDKLIRLTEQ